MILMIKICLKMWKLDWRLKFKEVYLLVGNKIDLNNRVVSFEEGKIFQKNIILCSLNTLIKLKLELIIFFIITLEIKRKLIY